VVDGDFSWAFLKAFESVIDSQDGPEFIEAAMARRLVTLFGFPRRS
jgi:hypothetical protein